MKTLQAGEQAPRFTLLNQNNKSVSLETILQTGPALVYFYPKALTPGCTVQACALRDNQQELANHKLTVLGISPDPVAKLDKFIEKHQLNFDLLSDENHKIAELFGVWGTKKFMGKTYDGIHRISFLVGIDGKVIKVFDKFKTKDHHQVVLDFLNSK